MVFLYEADGVTQHPLRGRSEQSTTNQHFFSELGQRIIKVASQLGPYGRLYEVDARLRPTGKSGALAISLDEFSRYFAEGQGQLWERQALCKARPIYGSPRPAKPPCRPSAGPLSATAGSPATPKKSGGCGRGWRRPRRGGI